MNYPKLVQNNELTNQIHNFLKENKTSFIHDLKKDKINKEKKTMKKTEKGRYIEPTID